MKTQKISTVLVTLFLLFSAGMGLAEEVPETWPRTVLITNDDGIEDPNILALALACAPLAETYVVAPLENQSSCSNCMSVISTRMLEVEKRDLGEGIHAYGVDGYPSDCVVFALTTLMKENPPDLVISGINGGPNIGTDRIVSGTIGGARIAAALGIPAVAVSGLNDEIPGSTEAVVQWVIDFVQTPLVSGLQSGQYLAISFPSAPPSDIRGVRVTENGGWYVDFVFTEDSTSTCESNREVWNLQFDLKEDLFPPESDIAQIYSGYIVVVPLVADEHDYDLLNYMRNHPEELPEWPYTCD